MMIDGNSFEIFWILFCKGMQFFSSVNTTPIAPPNHLCAEYRLQPSNTKGTLDSRAGNKTLDPSGCTAMHGGSLTVIISLNRPLSTDRHERCCHRHSTGKEVKASESFASLFPFSFPVGPPSAKNIGKVYVLSTCIICVTGLIRVLPIQ